MEVKMFHPALLPITADPEGSTRHKATIYHEKIPHDHFKVEFYDDLSNGRFVVSEYSDEFDHYSFEVGQGIVLRERNKQYTWWYDLVLPRATFDKNEEEDNYGTDYKNR